MEEFEQEYEYKPLPPATDMQKLLPAKQKKVRTPLVVAVLFASLLGGILGGAGVWAVTQYLQEQQEPEQLSIMMEGQREQTRIETVTVNTGELLTPEQVYAANVRSTVGITTSVTTNYWGFQTTSAASGSGFIISEDGHILTNYHVIENSDSISVAMFDGTTYDAALIGYDERNDIAVLKLEGTDFSPVIWGDSDNLNVGQTVLAIGNPLGELTFTLTAGLVSAINREVTLSAGVTMNLIQTDCAINSGNSGGALFNLYGEVIGVTNAKYSGSSGSGATIDNIGFAIPVNSIRSIVESIIEKGYISRPYIGISVIDVSQETQLYGIPAGAAIQFVTENSPAAVAGLQTGDVITEVDGQSVTSNSLVEAVANSVPGAALELTVYRQGAVMTVPVTVGEQIHPAVESSTQQMLPSRGRNPFDR